MSGGVVRRERARAAGVAHVLVLALLFVAAPVVAQEGFRPSERLPAPPGLDALPTEDPLELPPIRRVEPEAPRPSRRLLVRIDEVAFEGATILSEGDRATLAAAVVGRAIGTDALVALVEATTRLYHDRGFATSGAYLPDQDLEGGVLRIGVVEGRLGSVEVEGNRSFRHDYFASRLRAVAGVPLDVERLARRVSLLQLDPQVERIDARLEPGADPGVSELRLVVLERSPYSVALHADNHRTPSVGTAGGGVTYGHANVLGMGDRFSARFSGREGLLDFETRFTLPLWHRDTRLEIGYRHSESEVVDGVFEDLGIEGDFDSLSLGLVHPFHRSRRLEFWAGITGEWRRSRSTLLDRTFCFQARVDDCTPSVFVLRPSQELRWRTPGAALVARSTLSIGVGVLDATESTNDSAPDGRFVAWLGQLQAVARPPLPPRWPEWLRDSRLVGLGVLQFADDPLLSLEQISLGGAQSIRGFRQSLLVRDNGVIGSLEWRLPLLRDGFGRHVLALAPFVDLGRGWNVDDADSAKRLASVGAGVRVAPTEAWYGELYWGHRLEGQPDERDDLQDAGIHFRVVWNAF